MGLTLFSGADGDGDGMIDEDDYGVWKSHFGETIEQGAGSSVQGVKAEDPHPLAAALLPHPLDNSRPLPEGEAVYATLAEPGAGGYAHVDGRVVEPGNQPPALPAIGARGMAFDEWAVDLQSAKKGRGRLQLPTHSETGRPARTTDDALLAWFAASGRSGTEIRNTISRESAVDDEAEMPTDVLDAVFTTVQPTWKLCC